MQKHKISSSAKAKLIDYIDSFIPYSSEFNMPKASDIIEITVLINHLYEDEKFVKFYSKIAKSNFTEIDFDIILLEDDLFYSRDFINIINMNTIELYYSSKKIQTSLEKKNLKLIALDDSMQKLDFSLIEEVKDNFHKKIGI